MVHASPSQTLVNPTTLVECIEACFDCAQSCMACADACLGEWDVRMLARCIRLDLDCADAVRHREDPLPPDVYRPQIVRAAVQACARACELGSDECEQTRSTVCALPNLLRRGLQELPDDLQHPLGDTRLEGADPGLLEGCVREGTIRVTAPPNAATPQRRSGTSGATRLGRPSAEPPVSTAPEGAAPPGPEDSGEKVSVPGGTFTHVSPTELWGTMDENFPLVNVHVPFEGDLPGTDLSKPYNEVAQNLDGLPDDKGAKIVLYCKTGRMSAEASEALMQLRLQDLEGGMEAWRDAGLPLEGI